MKQPVVAVALCYGAGVILGHFVEAPLLATFIWSFVILGAALFFDRMRPPLLPLLLFLSGWLNLSVRTALVSPHDLRTVLEDSPKLVTVRGHLAETPSERMSARRAAAEDSHTLAEIEVVAVRLRGGDWQPAFGRIVSRTPGTLASNFFNGQTIEVIGVAQFPSRRVAEGVFDYERYLRLRGIHHELKVESPRDWKIYGAVHAVPIDERFRTWAQRTLARGLPEADESLRLQWAMLLGWQTALTAEVSEPFMRSGTMHIFAISGLHIALIAGIFVALFRAVTLPRSICGAIVIPIIWFYTMATGWQVSAIRSTVMMTIIILGWSIKRPTNLLNSLAAAAIIILIWQPEQLFQASFQLSFFVVLSIALLLPSIEKLPVRFFRLDPFLPYDLRPRWQRLFFKCARPVWICLATSFAAFIGSMPLIAYYFHLFTPGSLLANLIVVPVSALALMSGLGAILTGDFIPWLTDCFNNSGWFWMRSMIFLSESATHLPGAWCYVSGPGLLLFVLYYGVLLAACAGWFMHRALRWITLGCVLTLAGCWFISWKREHAWHRLTVVPLSGGHAAFVQPRGTRDWLIDCGSESAVDFTLKPFLQANGVNHVENFLLTHGDARQIGGAIRLNKLFPVRQAFASPVASRSSRYREALSELELRSKLHKCATNGFRFPPWTILHPNASDHFPSAEDNAVVALGIFDGVRVLLASDLGRAGQNAIFTRHPELRADIIIAGLPTNDEPLATEWLETLRSKFIVVADSESPANRRASTALVRRLQQSGATVVFAREAGAVTFLIRNGTWRVTTARPVSALE